MFPKVRIVIAAVTLTLLPGILHAQWVTNGVPICISAGNQQYPAIASDGSGGAIITWSGTGSPGICAQRVNFAGVKQWADTGVVICTMQSNPTIVSDGTGGAIITWSDFRNGNMDVYAQRVNAAGIPQWIANGVAICTADSGQWNQQIVSDDTSGAIITWYDRRNGNGDIFAQKINAAGVPLWTANGVAICNSDSLQNYPWLISDGAGGAIVTWRDNRNSNYDVYAQRVNSTGIVQWTANGVAVCNDTNEQGNIRIVLDGAGGAVIAWMDTRIGGGNRDVYSQRVNSASVVQWTSNGVAVSNGSCEGDPAIVSDGLAGAIITWADYRNGPDDIYAQRINSSGLPQWGATSVAICAADSSQCYPHMVTDGSGGAIITWMDSRSGKWGIYAQRVNAIGAVQWVANGVAVRNTAKWANDIVSISDGVSGAIVAWDDNRNEVTSQWDIYAQRVYANGSVGVAGYRSETIVSSGYCLNTYPNPSLGLITFNYNLPKAANVKLAIYNIAGQVIKTLKNDYQHPGHYSVQWNGRDESGQQVASGIYFYRIQAGEFNDTKKLVILR